MNKFIALLVFLFCTAFASAWDDAISWDYAPQDPAYPDVEFVLANEFIVYEANGPGSPSYNPIGSVTYQDGVSTYNFDLLNKSGIRCYQVYAVSAGGVPSQPGITDLLARPKFCLGPRGVVIK